MGKLQQNIRALINYETSRGVSDGKIAQRLIEAGIEIMADNGEITKASRIRPIDLEDGTFVVTSFTTANPADPMSLLAAAFGEMPIEAGDRFILEIGDNQFSVQTFTGAIDDANADKDDTIREAAETFDFYAKNHVAKGPEHFEKAKRNMAMARKCYNAIGVAYSDPAIGTAIRSVVESELPVTVQEVTGNIAESELAARYAEGKAAGATLKAAHAGSQDTRDRLEWAARLFGETAHELRQGMHLPALMIEGRVIPYNEDRDTGIRHATALQAFFDDVYARNVKAGWWSDITTGSPKKRNVGELFILFVTEIVEAYDHWCEGTADDKLPDYPGLGVELGDLAIRLADFCGALAAGKVIDSQPMVHNPGRLIFEKIGDLAREYEAIRKTPKAVGDPEEAGFLPPMLVGPMIDAKLDFNASREDHKIENRLKDDGKRT